jgi:transcriptional regulator with XRE-family HTH domain
VNDVHNLAGPLRGVVIDYLRRQQEQGSPRASDTAMAERLGVSKSAWTQIRQGTRGLGLEVLCRAIKAYPGLFAITVSFLGSLVSETHTGRADEHMRDKEDDREGIGAGRR